MQTMTDEQKYSELLKEIGNLIHAKNETIKLQAYRIKCLETEIEELRKHFIKAEGEN